jgi:CubicO group peptidase (beta-lactamase class C family)
MRAAVPILLLVLLSGCTLSRRLWWNAPGYADQFRFPADTVAPAAEPWPWPVADPDPRLGERIRVVHPVLGLETLTLNERLAPTATQAFLIIRRDTILYEHYGGGLAAEDPMSSFSVAKTFIGHLLGVGLAEGWIGKLDDPVNRYLPEFRHPDVTIGQLADMTSGIHFPPDGWQYYTPHLDRLPAKVRGQRRPPGSGWRYENGNTQLLAMVLERASGETLPSLLETRLWSRIGTEAPLLWSTDGHGTVKAFCCLNATARDFARFGRLMLRQGDWNGERLVPADYLATAAVGDTANGRFIRYRRQQWLENAEAGIFFANGLYGQYLYVHPGKEVVIVRFARESAHVHAVWSELFGMILEQL